MQYQTKQKHLRCSQKYTNLAVLSCSMLSEFCLLFSLWCVNLDFSALCTCLGGGCTSASIFSFCVRFPGRDLPAVGTKFLRVGFTRLQVCISIAAQSTVEAFLLLNCHFREDTSFPSLDFNTILINHVCLSFSALHGC